MTLQSTNPPYQLPPELADLPFGSPEFKDMNERLGHQDKDVCAEVLRGMPSWINLTGTTVCNLKCVMCNQFLDPNSPKWFMSDAVYDRVLAELYPFVKYVQFSAFGEPLMTPKMDQKLDDLERTHTKLDIVTNGTLMMKDPRTRDQLLRVLSQVTFSLDGATAPTYNAIRTGADFDDVMSNIEGFCSKRSELPEETRPRLSFNYILMHQNVHEGPKFVELCHSLGAQQITFNHLVVFHESLKNESLQFDKARSNEYLAQIRETADRLGVPITMPPLFKEADDQPPAETAAEIPVTKPDAGTASRKLQARQPDEKCMFLWERAYIGVNGEVVPCCVAGAPSFGDMMEAGFAAVWNGDTYRTHRRHVFTSQPHGMCRNCHLIFRSPDQVDEEGFLKF